MRGWQRPKGSENTTHSSIEGKDPKTKTIIEKEERQESSGGKKRKREKKKTRVALNRGSREVCYPYQTLWRPKSRERKTSES